jgi:hypothetical protein
MQAREAASQACPWRDGITIARRRWIALHLMEAVARGHCRDCTTADAGEGSQPAEQRKAEAPKSGGRGKKKVGGKLPHSKEAGLAKTRAAKGAGMSRATAWW